MGGLEAFEKKNLKHPKLVCVEMRSDGAIFKIATNMIAVFLLSMVAMCSAFVHVDTHAKPRAMVSSVCGVCVVCFVVCV